MLYWELRNLRTGKLVSLAKRLQQNVSDLWRIYDNYIKPFEKTDDEYRKRLNAIYKDRTSGKDKWNNFWDSFGSISASFLKSFVFAFVGAFLLALAPGWLIVGALAVLAVGCIIMANVPEESVPSWLSGAKKAADAVADKAVQVLEEGPIVLVEDIGQGFMDQIQTPEGIAAVSGMVVGFVIGGIAGAKVKPKVEAKIKSLKKKSVVYGSDDIAGYEFNMIENPGPLAEIEGNPASNFYGGRYNMEVLSEDTIYYRAGQNGKPLGQWFTTEPAESVVKVRIDTAVKPQWIDPVTGELTGTSAIDMNYAIKIPQGTTIYTGPVGNQGGVYCGGSDIMQIFIEKPWNIDGVEIISQTPLN